MTQVTEKSDLMKNASSAADKTANWSSAKKEFADRVISSSAGVRSASSRAHRDRSAPPPSSQNDEK
jgi:hypothetical protein